MANNFLFNDVLILVDEKVTNKDKYGNKVTETTQQKVFCNTSGVSRREFYMAGNSGYKPTQIFVINDFEYKGQEKVIYKDKELYIIKTYPLANGVIELTTGEKTGGK